MLKGHYVEEAAAAVESFLRLLHPRLDDEVPEAPAPLLAAAGSSSPLLAPLEAAPLTAVSASLAGLASAVDAVALALLSESATGVDVVALVLSL